MRLVVEYLDKDSSYYLAFFLRVALSLQFIQKPVRCIDAFYIEAHVFVLIEYFLKFIFPQKSVVDKNAVQLFSDGLMKQYGCNGGIYTAR